jgi:hypothetical protein
VQTASYVPTSQTHALIARVSRKVQVSVPGKRPKRRRRTASLVRERLPLSALRRAENPANLANREQPPQTAASHPAKAQLRKALRRRTSLVTRRRVTASKLNPSTPKPAEAPERLAMPRNAAARNAADATTPISVATAAIQAVARAWIWIGF